MSEPICLLYCRAIEPEVPHAHRHEKHRLKGAGLGKRRQVDQRQLGAKLLISADAFVVVDEISRSVNDQMSAIELDTSRMMRRVAVHHIGGAFIDECFRESLLAGGNL